MSRVKRDLLDIFRDCFPSRLTNGQIKMMCPFRDNHPDGKGSDSFFVSPDIGAYHCFSCHAKGSLRRLLTKVFKVGYFEAVELTVASEETERKEKSFELDIVWKKVAPRAFLERGFSRETLWHFQFGKTPDGWIVIPFFDSFVKPKELVGYQKRKDGKERLTINSKHFKKSEYLYNYDLSYSYVILVEGYSDVLRMFEHGYNATAVLGADVSQKQAEMLRKFDRVYCAFDNDEAGRYATEVAYHLLDRYVDLRFIPYDAKDPGECKDKSLWSEYFSEATDYMEYTLQMAMLSDDYLKIREKVKRRFK